MKTKEGLQYTVFYLTIDMFAQETNCAKADQYAKSVTKWVNVKMFIVLQVKWNSVFNNFLRYDTKAILNYLQIGIAILREMLNLGDDELPDDPSNLIVPLQFNSSEYEERMEKLFTKFESLYKTKSGKHRQKYTDHICTLTAILNAVPENEDKSHDARINVQGTHFLLSKNRLRPTVTYLFRFIQSMETTVLSCTH